MNHDAHLELASLLHRLGELLAEITAHQPPTIPEPRQSPERTLLTVEEAANRLGISRTRAYALISRGDLESIRIGRLRRVPTSAIAEFARRLTTYPHAA
ncbi:helix-turn-helix domain-containing protein [Saccharothrix sp.]|uniref:helix-turn-helix domain-containing protein n=1 Tax=Saccharothrix sp. TaxID=1873460 RepID=UPI002811831B|nr:helix-turn-helix domain-containing protein [Saccharothrix sp.]